MIVGICDWGIGGLGFFRLLRQNRPDLDVIYFGDQGFTPYGRAETGPLTARLNTVQEWFKTQGASQLVVACNAASTVLPYCSQNGIETTGVIQPALDAVLLESGTIGIIGGRRTIRSGAYRRPLVSAGFDVRQRVAQPLSGLIEDGKAQDPHTIELLQDILVPIRNVDRLVLACTHYIVLADAVRRFMPDVRMIDPATETWKWVAPSLPPVSGHLGRDTFYTSGNPSLMEDTAWNAFGVKVKVERWS